jgi:hypothetical protein
MADLSKGTKKTFALLFCDKQDFLRKKGKVIKTNALNHCLAIDHFLDNYHDDLINQSVMTFCFEEREKEYAYTYRVID